MHSGMDDLIAEIDGKTHELMLALDLVLYHRMFGNPASVVECELYCKQIDTEILVLEKELAHVTPADIKKKADLITAIQYLLGVGAQK